MISAFPKNDCAYLTTGLKCYKSIDDCLFHSQLKEYKQRKL